MKTLAVAVATFQGRDSLLGLLRSLGQVASRHGASLTGRLPWREAVVPERDTAMAGVNARPGVDEGHLSGLAGARASRHLVVALSRRFGRSRLCRGALRRVKTSLEDAATLPAIGSFLAPLVDKAARIAGSEPASVCSLDDVLQIAYCLERADIPFWLVGGWGVDALAGVQLRYHTDLDLAVDDLAGRSDAIAAALAPLGFEPRGNRRTDLWWLPEGADFARPGGHTIEVLELNWDLLASVPLIANRSLDPNVLREDLRSGCLGQGRLGPRTIPCLSLSAQLLFHQGYALDAPDLIDMAVLRSLAGEPSRTAMGRETALIVPTFELDARLRQIWSRFNSATTALPPHLTVMSPFLPGEELTGEVLARLDGLFGGLQPFRFELSSAGRSDEGALYLAPTAADPFVNMTKNVVEAHPSLSPYAGTFPNVTPHLTLGEDVPVAHLRRTVAQASRCLPVPGEATEVWLVAVGDDGWSLLHRFGLGDGRQGVIRAANADKREG